MNLKTSKIVGGADETSWSQVHVFKPLEPEKLESHGELMAALAFKVKKEELEVSSFGAEIIQRLQEIYYSNESEKLAKKVTQTTETLAAEFLSEVELNLVMAIIKEESLYIGKIGVGQAFLKRGGALVKLLSGGEEVMVVSGKLKTGDKLLIGTEQFFKLADEEKLKPVMEQTEEQKIEEDLAGIVHGQSENSQAAAVFLNFSETVEEIKEEPGEEQEREEKEPKLNKIKLKFKQGWDQVKDWIKLRGETAVFIGGGGEKLRKKQKSAAVVAIILMVIFGMSLVLAGRKRQKTKAETRYQSVIEEVSYKYEEASGLLSLNPLRARSLLKDSQEAISLYKTETGKELNQELKDYEAKITEALGSVQREYKLDSAQEWYDFSLVKLGFKGSDWESEETEALVWDTGLKSLVKLNLETKAAELILGGDKIDQGNLAALAGQRGMIIGGNKIIVIEVKDGKVVAEVGADGWGKIEDAVGFGGNLYLLDRSKTGQIWKYLGVDDGLSAKRSYLKGESYDLSEAVSMAIDGSVWVLFSNGSIAKYIQGVKDAFVVAGLDQPLAEPIKIFTNPETEKLYVLDRKNTRVVVINKAGEYQAQYIWPGMASAKDLIVNESLKKIFLLTGEKIFVIDLKN